MKEDAETAAEAAIEKEKAAERQKIEAEVRDEHALKLVETLSLADDLALRAEGMGPGGGAPGHISGGGDSSDPSSAAVAVLDSVAERIKLIQEIECGELDLDTARNDMQSSMGGANMAGGGGGGRGSGGPQSASQTAPASGFRGHADLYGNGSLEKTSGTIRSELEITMLCMQKRCASDHGTAVACCSFRRRSRRRSRGRSRQLLHPDLVGERSRGQHAAAGAGLLVMWV